MPGLTFTVPDHSSELRLRSHHLSDDEAATRNPHSLPVFGQNEPTTPILYLPPLLSSLPDNYPLPQLPKSPKCLPLATETRLPDIDPASLSLHRALHYFRPLHDQYAATPYEESFNWDELELPEEDEREWYCVAFRSRRKDGSDGTPLYEADRLAHEEAIRNGGLIMYWYGVPSPLTGLNLATCIWQSRQHAVAANSRPHHLRAAKLAKDSYEIYDLERYVLRKYTGEKGVRVEPYIDGPAVFATGPINDYLDKYAVKRLYFQHLKMTTLNNNNLNSNTNPFTNELNSNRTDGLTSLETDLTSETTKRSYPSETYGDHGVNNGPLNGPARVTVVETTTNSLPTSQDGITHRENSQFDYLANAGETVRKYLPTRVVDVLGVGALENSAGSNNNKNTLPSQDTTFQPSRGGVGSLPGNPSEASVAKLPEERALEAQVGKEMGREGVMGTVADPHNVDSIPAKTNNSSPLASESLGTAAQFTDPITEPFPKSGNGVALQHLARPDVKSTEHTRPMPTFISSTLTPEIERDQETHDKTPFNTNKSLPNQGTSPSQATTTKDKNNLTSNDHHDDNDDASRSYSTAQATRQAPNTSPDKSHSEQPLPKSFANDDELDDNHLERNESSIDKSSTTDSENKQTSGKPSIGQKIKGEVKVIAGKITNDQAKVESGQAMKKGTNA
ncbi:hypothetical protein Clacol_000378 [Clathrus columnatus]|uniref:Uncharacterized protein n=1 Tax=Clathrus columnatus TaxID=1419009 RepID=A0AAV5A0G9_9AGAM|nr:hypothetical protein Clacol_000378 [Clathrus columnatus]